MGSLNEFSWKLRMALRAYPYRRIDPVPWTPLSKPLAACRVALVTTAGLVGPGQPDFDEGLLGGDYSYRVIPRGTPVAELRDTHRSESYDHSGVAADPNLAFPLDRLEELARRGRVGEVAPRHLSFMGSITAPGRLRKRSAPEAAQLFVEDGVDVVLLVPV